MIRKNASVAFEMDCQNALQHGETACTHSYYYASVLGEGKAEILEGDEKVQGSVCSDASYGRPQRRIHR